MIILLSPSKTQEPKNLNFPIASPKYPSLTKTLSDLVMGYDQEAIGRFLKVKDQLKQATYDLWQQHDQAPATHAIATYTGLVFKYIPLEDYGTEQINYLEEHLRICSALYGLLHPLDGIQPYRLDMTMKPDGLNLYHHWQEAIKETLDKEELIIDLASKEFSKLYKGEKITIEFRDYQPDQDRYKNLATYSKMARGQLLDQMVQTNAKKVADIKALTFNDYHYNDALSSEKTLFFTRFDE